MKQKGLRACPSSSWSYGLVVAQDRDGKLVFACKSNLADPGLRLSHTQRLKINVPDGLIEKRYARRRFSKGGAIWHKDERRKEQEGSPNGRRGIARVALVICTARHSPYQRFFSREP